LLKPDNREYQSYQPPIIEVLELWKFTGSINTKEYDEHELNLISIVQIFNGFGAELKQLEKSLKTS
jgi:hypothetical protein